MRSNNRTGWLGGRKVNFQVKPSLIALAVAQAFVVTAPAEAATITVKKGCGLSQAILSANQDRQFPGSQCEAGAGADTIELTRDIVIKKPFGNSDHGMPLIKSEITFNGNGHSITRDDNAGPLTILDINGASTQTNPFYLDRGSITINDLTISNANGIAGLRASNFENLTLNQVKILDNSGGDGLLVRDVENIQIIDSTISRNSRSGVRVPDNPYYRYDGYGTLIDGFTTDYNINVDISNTVISDNGQHGVDFIILHFYSSGTSLNVINGSEIYNNTSTGISANIGSTLIEDSTVSGNRNGGVRIELEPDINFPAGANELNVSRSTLNFNRTEKNGGAVNVSYATRVNISDSTISNNSSAQSGGALAFYGSTFSHSSTRVSIHNTVLSRNDAQQQGGAIFGDKIGSLLKIEDSQLIENRSGLSGGAISVSPGLNRYGTRDVSSDLSVTSSVLSGNSTEVDGGAIYAQDTQGNGYGNAGMNVTVVNSTVSNNRASNGGAIRFKSNFYGDNSEIKLLNTTFSGNFANNGGGLYSGTANLNIVNSILAGNRPTEIERSPLMSDATSNNNILGNADNQRMTSDLFVNFSPSADDIVASIDGNTPTELSGIINSLDMNASTGVLSHTLPETSPAIDAADSLVCGNTPVNGVDQLGAPRLISSFCDIGAVESALTLDSFAAVNVADVIVLESHQSGASSRAKVKVSLTRPVTVPVKIGFETVMLSAAENEDYIPRSGNITFAPGETEKTRSIELVNDVVSEFQEVFEFKLSNLVTSNADIVVAKNISRITVIDDDNTSFGSGLPRISVDIEPRENLESVNARAKVIASLSKPFPFPVTVDYETRDGTAIQNADYIPRQGQIYFAPGQTQASRFIEIVNDLEDEADEIFSIILTNPNNALVEFPIRNIEIHDANRPTISLSDVEVNEGDRRVKIEITLSEPRDHKVSVEFGTLSGSAVFQDYVRRRGDITFAPGQTVARRYIELIDDDEPEPNESFKLVLSYPESAAIADFDAEITIIDND